MQMRILWFFGLYCGSILLLGAVAYGIRYVIR